MDIIITILFNATIIFKIINNYLLINKYVNNKIMQKGHSSYLKKENVSIAFFVNN